jgi:hypothetical protein
MLAAGLLAAPWLMGAARAADPAPCDPAMACFDVTLKPANMLGDFYLDGVLAAAGVSSARLVGTPSVPHTLEVRNIQEPGAPGFGDLYIYPNQAVVQSTRAGWVWVLSFYVSQKQYLKGTLVYICDPKFRAAGESLACRPTVDGVLQPDVAPGASASYYLTGGGHSVHTDLVGDSAGNYSSTARDDSVFVTAGWRNYFTAAFTKNGQFNLSLYPAGLVADLYVDGALVAAQSSTASLYVGAGVQHKVEARNITDPAAAGKYKLNDAALNAIVYAGRSAAVVLRPAKVWLTGTLSLVCYFNQKLVADDVQCAVSVDGAPLGTVAHNGRGLFSLANGPHTVTVTAAGASAGQWPAPKTLAINTVGGYTWYATASFLKGVTAVSAPPAGAGPAAPANSISGPFELGGQVDSFNAPDKMKYAGMTWVKRQIWWSPGATLDTNLINDAHAKGFKILVALVGDAGFFAGGVHFDEYAAFAGRVAAAGADGIEIMNETNLDRSWPRGEIDPVKYTDLLRRSYIQIRAANPGTLIVSAAPAPTGAEGAFGLDRVWNDDRYVRGLVAAGALNYMDCLGVHYNEGIISPTLSSGDPRDSYYTRYYGGMVNTYLAFIGGQKQLCFTEFGYLSPDGYPPLPSFFGWGGNTDANEQAQWLAEAVSIARSSGKVRLLIVFNVDFTQYGDDPIAGFAMIRPGGGCPACDTLHTVTGGR